MRRAYSAIAIRGSGPAICYNYDMHLQLRKAKLAKFVDEKVRTGEFRSREAVVETALIDMMANEQTLTQDDLRAIQKSKRQFARGAYVDFDDFAAKMRCKFSRKS
jgi:Arc/MetJ-type ribon-helix-helix transcriptional regulator